MNAINKQPANEKNLRIGALMDLLGIGRSTVYDLIKKNQLPEPLKIGRSSVWLKSEIDAVIEERKSARCGMKPYLELNQPEAVDEVA